MRVLCLLTILAALVSCTNSGVSSKTYSMGEAAQVGALAYTVTEAEWRDELPGSGEAPVRAKNRFLLIRTSISNGGSQEVSAPLLTVEDSGGKSYPELSEVEGVDSWLGLLRILPPAGRIEGRLVFDVPPAVYHLRVNSGGDPEMETSALVAIPLTAPKPAPPVSTMEQ